MSPQTQQATVLGRPVQGAANRSVAFRFGKSLGKSAARTLFGRTALAAVLLTLIAAAPSHALYTAEFLSAYRVPNKSLKIDGRPDSLWRAVAGLGMNAGNKISFTDYKKMVLLQPEKVRNDDPSKYVPNPVNGSITMLAAYDNEALYFFFVITTKTVVNAKTVCPALADAWKADAAEVFIDPSPWDPDTSVYRSYFTADASGLVFGTSPRTIQIDKPISRRDSTRFYYRNRASADKFQVPGTLPTDVIAVSSAHSAADTTTVGVEMKIPFWSGANALFSAGHTMFLSWGFNMYPDSLWANCNSNPIAYRWAKNFLNYDGAGEKPPGWHQGDSTHYDPTRSWDGWGPLRFSGNQADIRTCRSQDVFNANWDVSYWANNCTQGAVSLGKATHLDLDAAGMPVPSLLRVRDVRGRLRGSGRAAGYRDRRLFD